MSRDSVAQAAFRESLRLLNKHEASLCSQYPAALVAAFSGGSPGGAKTGAGSGSSTISFDELELMDDSQVQESVELARAQQAAQLATEAPLAPFNALICSAQGLKTVQPDRNPLRPEVFVRTLHTLLKQSGAPAADRMRWLQYMGAALGHELADLYVSMTIRLREAGVVAAGYVVTQGTGAGGSPGQAAAQAATARAFAAGAAQAPVRAQEALYVPATAGSSAAGSATASQGTAEGSAAAAAASSREQVILTVNQLRRLLSGELDDARSRVASGTSGTGGTNTKTGFEASLRVDSQHTVPAAFEALQEMKQVDHVMRRLQAQTKASSLPAVPAGTEASLAGLRQQLRANARGLGQQLGLEVVNLMVENIAGDKRLLAPVQQVVRELEPALLRLALIDPRFFSDKMHPARRLLEQMTQRSLAWQDASAPAFQAFMEPLTQAVQALANMPIESVEPFDFALKTLTHAWSDQHREKRHRETAVKSLLQAEQRNILADKISREIRAREDGQMAPHDILLFLLGPWAQVMAQARLADRVGMADPGGYGAVINDLIWSGQPELARNSIPRLTRIIPGLLSTLREGLASIDYPQNELSRFFNELMELHQQALRPAGASGLTQLSTPVSTRAELEAKFAERPQEEPWLAPAEAKDSGFMDTGMLDESLEAALDHNGQKPDFAPTQPGFGDTGPTSGWRQTAAPTATPEDLIPAGSWVEFVVGNRATRTQLTWASPHGTLFMFTNAEGATHSMTRRSMDKLLSEGGLRIISDHAVVDEALDAVAEAAMRNSLDIAL